MADVIIKGMDMPPSCFYCPIGVEQHFTGSIRCPLLGKSVGYFNEAKRKRDPDCPLFPLPAGHGNMIDVSALEDMDFESCDTDDCYEIKWRVSGRNHIRQIIKDAPIIIPAEGDNN